jgi:membrane protease YdiL (CAAX protease family)
LSSVIAILAMQELGLLFSIPVLLMLKSWPIALSFGYGLAGMFVCFFVVHYHAKQDVSLRDILMLRTQPGVSPAVLSPGVLPGPRPEPKRGLQAQAQHLPLRPFSRTAAVLLALMLGLLYGVIAHFYGQLLHEQWIAQLWPNFAKELTKSDALFAESPNMVWSYAFLAVLVAPWAEEFLFRGLMFRAMRSQWRFWPAMAVSSAFFMVLHPVSAWPMVFLLGASNAWLFVRSRRLWPCVLLHFVYNLCVIGAMLGRL